MAFSNDVREELINIKTENADIANSFLSAAISFCGNMVFTGGGNITFYFVTENAGVARRIVSDFKTAFSESLELYRKRNYNFTKKKIYILKYPAKKNSKDILKKLSVLADYKGTITIRSDIDIDVVCTDERKKSFLRGAYVASGSISNPEKSYHLEFITHSYSYARNFADLLNGVGIRSNVLERNDSYVIYVKDSESISDFLNYVGAHSSMFKLEDIRIKKQMRNDVNRLVNCESANLKKIAKTYVRQKKSIEYIIQKKSLDYLPEELREIATLRLQNVDDSLKELADKMSEPISKSGVNHRLKKIEMIAESLLKEEK